MPFERRWSRGAEMSKKADKQEEKPDRSPRYYGHVAVFEDLGDGIYRLVVGGTDDAAEQFDDAAAADAWIKSCAGTEEPRTLQVGRLFVDRRYTVQEVTETRTVVVSDS